MIESINKLWFLYIFDVLGVSRGCEIDIREVVEFLKRNYFLSCFYVNVMFDFKLN